MRLPTAIKLGIVGAWMLLLATVILMRPLFGGSIYDTPAAKNPLYYISLATCFAGLIMIFFCQRISRRLETTPDAISDAWLGLAATHVMLSPFLAFFIIFATR